MFRKIHALAALATPLALFACAAPKSMPSDLASLRSSEELGQASRRAYGQAQSASSKDEKLKFSHEGIVYAQKCLKSAPQEPACLYFETLNTGIYIRHHIPNYQRGLKTMVRNCETLIEVRPDFEQAGCYRVLGNIYSQAPSFSLNPKNITQDLDKSVTYFREAVKLAPDYPLNRLFLAKALEQTGETDEAKTELQAFDRLPPGDLERDYPDWKKERDALAQSLLK
ncbi:MAG TPA: tetratricopeptide repeat protein [bacterium]|nr:tetratricopeptide repeat protein [bacterium]